jgi:hypothetical protein
MISLGERSVAIQIFLRFSISTLPLFNHFITAVEDTPHLAASSD